MNSLYIVSVFFNLFCFMYCSLSWIELYGTRYTYGGVVVIDSDLLPKFAVIKDVIMDSSFHFFISLWKFCTPFVLCPIIMHMK